MHNSLFLTHVAAVSIFNILNFIKLILLLTNSTKSLTWLARYVTIPERIISVILLATGIYLITQVPAVNVLMIIKLCCVAVAIPLAIIAYKRKIKLVAVASMLCLLAAYGLAEASRRQSAKGKITEVSTSDGRQLFNAACSQCHGVDANKPLKSVPDLHFTNLQEPAILQTVSNGRGSMPAYKAILTAEQLQAVAAYVHNLKK